MMNDLTAKDTVIPAQAGIHVSQPRDPAFIHRLFWVAASAVLLWPMLVLTEFKIWTLFTPESLKPTLKFLADFFPPKLEPEFLLMVAKETWRTVAMATAGITLALVFAIPLSLITVRTLSISSLVNHPERRMTIGPSLIRTAVRWLLIVLRSVPELIWALIFVRVVGLGPTAGVLAIALTYTGMLGKVYGEILESSDGQNAAGQSPTQTLLRNGSGRLQAFLYALLPQSAAELASYTIYRWECAIRSSAVLGFVGAGGLGQQMDASMKMFNGSEVSTMLIVFMLLVWLADLVSSRFRKGLS
jgi:phosphonate transport system permease protein